MAVLGKEIGKKWTFICVLMQFVIAYLTAMVTFALFNLIAYLGMANSLLLLLLVACVVGIFKRILSKKKQKNIHINCSGCNRCK